MSGVERFINDFKAYSEGADVTDREAVSGDSTARASAPACCLRCEMVLAFSWEETLCDPCKRECGIPVTYGVAVPCPIPSERERNTQGVGRIEFGIWRPE